jgi:hypothetical protein
LTTARKFVVRGRPPGKAAGRYVSTMAHAPSFRSVSYRLPKLVLRPTHREHTAPPKPLLGHPLRLAVNLRNGPEEDMAFFDCKGPAAESVDKEYDEFRSIIMNGSASKVLYDCRHGIMGFFLHPDDPPSKAITIPGIGGAYLSAYLRLCPAIVGGMSYMPNSTQNR